MSSNIQNARCRVKYCGPCLKNRYGESLENIKTQTTSEMPRKERERHVPNENFAFQYVVNGVCPSKDLMKIIYKVSAVQRYL